MIQMNKTICIGDAYLIPDVVTRFGKNNGKSHYWIVKNIINNHRAILCPRTTKLNNRNKNRGIYQPADHFFGFNRPGVVLKKIERRFSCKQLGQYKYLGNMGWNLFTPFKKKKAKKNVNKLIPKSINKLRNPVMKLELQKCLKNERGMI